jgi:hypothetical protein
VVPGPVTPARNTIPFARPPSSYSLRTSQPLYRLSNVGTLLGPDTDQRGALANTIMHLHRPQQFRCNSVDRTIYSRLLQDRKSLTTKLAKLLMLLAEISVRTAAVFADFPTFQSSQAISHTGIQSTRRDFRPRPTEVINKYPFYHRILYRLDEGCR